MNYFINELYKYQNNKKTFKLVEVEPNGFAFYFEGGHWCTDNVFMNLIRVKTGVQVCEETQLQLF